MPARSSISFRFLVAATILLSASHLGPLAARAIAACAGENGPILFNYGSNSPFASLERGVYSIEPDGSELQFLLGRFVSNASSVCGEDGFFVSASNPDTPSLRELLSVARDGSSAEVVLDGISGSGSVSPDGTKIAYSSADPAIPNRFGVFVLDITEPSGEAAQVDSDLVSTPAPVWGPDSGWFVYERRSVEDQMIKTRVVRFDLEDQAAGVLAEGAARPTVSPDGTRIAYIGDVTATSWSIILMGSDGSDPAPLPLPIPFPDNAVFSPDGSKLAFTGRDDGANNTVPSSIFLVNLDGSELERIIEPSEGNVPTNLLWLTPGCRLSIEVQRMFVPYAGASTQYEPAAGGSYPPGAT